MDVPCLNRGGISLVYRWICTSTIRIWINKVLIMIFIILHNYFKHCWVIPWNIHLFFKITHLHPRALFFQGSISFSFTHFQHVIFWDLPCAGLSGHSAQVGNCTLKLEMKRRVSQQHHLSFPAPQCLHLQPSTLCFTPSSHIQSVPGGWGNQRTTGK